MYGRLRIPAALNGLVGFKPTARRVPREGVLPLSISADSVGPIAHSVADCALLDQVLAAEDAGIPAAADVRGLRLAVPQTVVMDDLSESVAIAFAAALARLSAAGASVIEVPMTEFALVATVNPRGGISGAEAFWWHRNWIRDEADQYDPRVLARIRPGESITAADYIEMLQQRQRFIRIIGAAASGYDAMLMPTTAALAENSESLHPLIAAMVRNGEVATVECPEVSYRMDRAESCAGSTRQLVVVKLSRFEPAQGPVSQARKRWHKRRASQPPLAPEFRALGFAALTTSYPIDAPYPGCRTQAWREHS